MLKTITAIWTPLNLTLVAFTYLRFQDEGSGKGSGSEGGSPYRSSPGRYGRSSPAASEDEDDYDSEEEEEYDDRPRKKKRGVSNFIIDEAGNLEVFN